MIDGVYQSLVAFYFVYELFASGTFATASGLDLAEYRRMGIYAATAAVCAANIYVLYNSYRWDWLMLLIIVISTLLVWFWTGVYTSFTSSGQFYKAAAEVYGNVNFWAYLLVAVIACLLPRFIFKFVQKTYFPLDVDIIREQVKQGKFDYLKENTSYLPPPPDKAVPQQPPADVDAPKHKASNAEVPEEEDLRPIYPPSVAPTATTHNPRSQNGSNSTDYTYRRSMEGLPPATRVSTEYRVRPSFDRARMSMDRVRPSFEASNDFTSAAMLTRMESAHSRNSFHGQRASVQGMGQGHQSTVPNLGSRLRNAIRRATVTREDAPTDLQDAPPMPASKSPPSSPPR
jgi:phospholipid-translocating ATPase